MLEVMAQLEESSDATVNLLPERPDAMPAIEDLQQRLMKACDEVFRQWQIDTLPPATPQSLSWSLCDGVAIVNAVSSDEWFVITIEVLEPRGEEHPVMITATVADRYAEVTYELRLFPVDGVSFTYAAKLHRGEQLREGVTELAWLARRWAANGVQRCTIVTD